MKLSIIVLSFNTKNLTTKCIKSIFSNYTGSILKKEIEVILVDNASTDGSAESLSNFKFHPANGGTNFKLIKNDRNFGFAKGNNIGAKEASGEFFLFLNTDTEVKDQGFLKMVKFLQENKKVGILGGKLKNTDGSSQASAGKFYTLGNFILMLLGAERFLLRESPRNVKRVDWVSGACMMIRRELFEKLSGFDEHFFMYIEDMELCFRARKLGFYTYFYPDLNLTHKELGSSNREFAVNQIYKGILHFYKKHQSFWQFIIVKFLLIAKALLAVSLGFITDNVYLKNTYTKALRISI